MSRRRNEGMPKNFPWLAVGIGLAAVAGIGIFFWRRSSSAAQPPAMLPTTEGPPLPGLPPGAPPAVQGAPPWVAASMTVGQREAAIRADFQRLIVPLLQAATSTHVGPCRAGERVSVRFDEPLLQDVLYAGYAPLTHKTKKRPAGDWWVLMQSAAAALAQGRYKTLCEVEGA